MNTKPKYTKNKTEKKNPTSLITRALRKNNQIYIHTGAAVT